MKRFENKVVVITGAGQGQGEHLAKRFYEDGARVALLELNEDNLNKMIQEYAPEEPERFRPYPIDVSNSDMVNEVFAQIAKDFGKIDFLCNNAGILRKSMIEESTDAHINLMIGVNLLGPMFCTRAAVPLMKENGGSILNVASILATFPNTGAGAYGAAKSGMITLTRVWAAELAPYNIRVNCYSPGTIVTPMMDEIFAQHREESKLAQIPLRRFGTCEDVYNLASFFCSEEASFLTGQTIGIDGGIWATQTPTAAWKNK
ncbi:MAG: SDR family oxidoreductase [Clostridia bacterium]|nr:SDR family oxidoreductase [Clostridia bacterium]MBR6860341.1 SDR family oxidoreductase [Acidaminococcaceae bacterium]